MMGFEGRRQWRQHKLFKLRANQPRSGNQLFCSHLAIQPLPRPGCHPHAKFAIRLNVVRRTKIVQATQRDAIEDQLNSPATM
jgi:hypothetical protein